VKINATRGAQRTTERCYQVNQTTNSSVISRDMVTSPQRHGVLNWILR